MHIVLVFFLFLQIFPILVSGKVLPNSVEFSCLRKLKAGTELNTLVIIEFRTIPLKTNQKLTLEFRQKNKIIYQLSRQISVQENLDNLEYWLPLPDGHYEVLLELYSQNSSVPLILSKTFYARSLSTTCAISDVKMMDPESGKIILQKDIYGINGRIPFQCDIYISTPGLFTASAVLYRQDENVYSDEAGKYTSFGQVSVALPQSQSGPFSFSNYLPADVLESGSYLLEILVYQDDKIIAEANTSFNIVWQEIPKIISQHEKYLRYMQWKFANEQLPEFVLSPTGFLDFWVQQNDYSSNYPYDAMEQYYLRVMASDSVLKESGSWNTPRARYFILLGEPDSISTYLYDSDSILAWRYIAPPLCKYFIKPKSESQWKEISLQDKIRLSFK